MLYSNFQDKKLSLLGFGAMRLPLCEDGRVDIAQTEEMMAYAFEHGVNYIDTAYPYHDGQSEIIMGEILSKYPRDSFYLATKYPGHQISSSYNPATIFEKQLEKCGVEYFDFYLLHNVYENSMQTYLDPKWGILDYFKEQRRLGRIRHLGFSTHGSVDAIEEFLDICGDDMEFCQIQLNYLDWTLQDAKAKYEMLTKRNIPVWVMEPVRGGKLVNLNDTDIAKLKDFRPDESVASWGFRFLQELPNVKMVLSGMSNLEQLADNIHTFESYKNLSAEEMQVLFKIAESMQDSIPCTSCRYCT
ncbi:MAG: aldo/keto reductase [Lachnospiraceae bacterium]|nr:aldo/keto reductase [Lachnospiraceae bacterium]